MYKRRFIYCWIMMDHPGPDHWKMMDRMVGYIKGTMYRTVKLREPTDTIVRGFTNSSYASSKDSRRSVTGIIVTVGGTPVMTQSKTQGIVTLSSCEAEYVACSACTHYFIFFRWIM